MRDLGFHQVLEPTEVRGDELLELAAQHPYAQWLKDNQITLDHLPSPAHVQTTNHETIRMRQRAFGYTDEDLKTILSPSALAGEEPVGSM